MREVTQDEAKQIRLELLKELDRFCSENGIRYYLGFGTLIGAIRHNGFIPWDDDCDVIMPRPDLEKLRKLYKSSLSYSLINNREDPFHLLAFDRLIDNRTYRQLGKYQIEGIDVELYPIDGVPSNKLICQFYLWFMHKMHILDKRLFHYIHTKAWCGEWEYTNFKPWWVRLFIKLYISIGTIFKYEDANMTEILFCNSYKLKAKDKNMFEHGEPHIFEGFPLMIPVQYDTFLKMEYGDYMTPPPIEKRVPYHGEGYYWKD